MKILFLTNVPSPYRVDFFNELGKHCELTVLFEKLTSDIRNESWKNFEFKNFNGIILKGKKISGAAAICLDVVRYIKKDSFDYIIVSNVASPTGMIAIQHMRIHKIPYYIEGDGGFAKSGKGFKESIKRYFIKGARGYFSTSKAHDNYYITYGAEASKIYRYPFTSLKDEDILSSGIGKEEKLMIRKELFIHEKKVVLAVGQFIYRKGFDILLKAAEKFSDDIGIYFVGGIPTEEYLNIKKENNLENVHFIGFKSKEELKKHYMAADVFVLPTREDIWGLVVNEAMASGLPVITTDKCISGLELVKNGENGFIIPTDNAEQLTEKIMDVLSDENILYEMSKNSLSVIREYTIEKMSERHLEVLKQSEVIQ